jgi:hypothetical protein
LAKIQKEASTSGREDEKPWVGCIGIIGPKEAKTQVWDPDVRSVFLPEFRNYSVLPFLPDKRTQDEELKM